MFEKMNNINTNNIAVVRDTREMMRIYELMLALILNVLRLSLSYEEV